jgi:ABC-type antimicrobial peptide transport system permease subunit
MTQLVSYSISNRRFAMLLLSVFAAVALVLAAVGIFGVISFTVSRRTQEIGLRLALGADKKDILRLIGVQSLTPILIGVGVGIASALVLTRFLSSLLYGVGGWDPLTFLGASGILIGTAFVACLIPALRAIKVDPMIALRYE